MSTDQDGSSDRTELVSEDGKNTKSVLCQRCGSKVLCPAMAVFTEKEVCWIHQQAEEGKTSDATMLVTTAVCFITKPYYIFIFILLLAHSCTYNSSGHMKNILYLNLNKVAV